MKTKLPSLVSILILTAITSVVWIGLNVYRALTTEAAPSVPNEISQALTPTLDKKTIDDIKGKLFIGQNEVPNVIISTPTATPTIVPSVAPSPTASSSATPTTSPTASASAETTL